MEKALKAHRKALEALHTGTLTVYQTITETNPETLVEEDIEKMLYENEPCRLSYRNKDDVAMLNEMTASANKEVDIFVSPEVLFPEGCRLIALWHGQTLELKRSGVPQLHATHNKYTAEIVKEHL